MSRISLFMMVSLALAFAGAGQVDAIATFNWDCTNSLATCNNACFSVNHGLHPGVLTYDSNLDNRPPRRLFSGCAQNPCNTASIPYSRFGNSCDEYPFASTNEGGPDATLRCVDSSENSSEGGQLGNFYKTIQNGDQFNIYVENYRGAQFCENVQAGNDGSEFHSVNGRFVDAKRRRTFGEFADIVTNTTVARRPFRQFETDAGRKVLLLSADDDSDQIGRELWSEKGSHKIVKEIF